MELTAPALYSETGKILSFFPADEVIDASLEAGATGLISVAFVTGDWVYVAPGDEWRYEKYQTAYVAN